MHKIKPGFITSNWKLGEERPGLHCKYNTTCSNMDGLGSVYLERIRIKKANPMQIGFALLLQNWIRSTKQRFNYREKLGNCRHKFTLLKCDIFKWLLIFNITNQNLLNIKGNYFWSIVILQQIYWFYHIQKITDGKNSHRNTETLLSSDL